MAARYATIADLPPEFDSFDARDLQYWLAATRSEIGLDAYGETASDAHAMLAAHRLKRAHRSTGEAGSQGMVASESVGDVSVSYATPTADSELHTTVYGQRYLALSEGVFVGGVLTL